MEEISNPLGDLLRDTFSKGALPEIRLNYLRELQGVKKWKCFSDYSLNEGKPNKVVSFTLIPHIVDPEELSAFIKSLQRKDIKHTRSINKDFLTFLRHFPILNFSFILDGHEFLMSSNKQELKTILNNSFNTVLNRLDQWKLNAPHMSESHDKLAVKIKCVLKLIASDKKTDYVRDMLLVTFLGGFVCGTIAKETKAEMLGWFSDRDAIHDLCNGIALDWFHINFHSMLEHNCQFLAAPAGSKDDEYYEEFTRIPDYITGTLADYDSLQNVVSKDKFGEMIKGFLVNNTLNNYVFRIGFNKNGVTECARIIYGMTDQ